MAASLLWKVTTGLGKLFRQRTSCSFPHNVQSVAGGLSALSGTSSSTRSLVSCAYSSHNQLQRGINTTLYTQTTSRSLLVATAPMVSTHRTRVTCSRTTGKPRTVKAVIKRFMRLNNGMWIRTRAGRGKKHWKKSGSRISRLQQHVFCNNTQCRLLDKMVNTYWKEKKFNADDPYEHYHKKTNLPDFKYEKRPFYP